MSYCFTNELNPTTQMRKSTFPLVSVVIPSYQHAPYVQNAVESVLQQTITDIEVIVVDDGSTDGTPDIVAGIRDSRLQLVRLADNRRDHARNIGLSLASGRYIAFQNSDDEWLPDKLAKQLVVMESRQDVGVVFTEVALINDVNHPTATWANGLFCDGKQKRNSSEWLQQLYYANCLCITSAMVRHNLLKQVGRFLPSLVQLSDIDMWIRLAAVSELDVVAEPLTRMRVIGHHNLSAPGPKTVARSVFEMADVLENYARPPLVDRLPSLFPKAFPAVPPQDPVLILALFACYATSGSVSHRLFADRVLSRLINDEDSRKRISAAFGPLIMKFFLEHRASLAVMPVSA